MMTASIAGMGWVTALGRDLDPVWKAIRENQTAGYRLAREPHFQKSVCRFCVCRKISRAIRQLSPDCAVPASSRTLQSPPRRMPLRPRE